MAEVTVLSALGRVKKSDTEKISLIKAELCKLSLKSLEADVVSEVKP